jgi:DNA-binding NtrC family response regulator
MDNKGKRVLIIDDDHSVCRAIELYITAKGVTVDIITDPSEFECYLIENKPNLIFLDYRMRPLTGKEILEIITHLKLRCPVVILSGYLTRDSYFEYKAMGAYDCLAKPPDLKKIDKILGDLNIISLGC